MSAYKDLEPSVPNKLLASKTQIEELQNSFLLTFLKATSDNEEYYPL